MKYLKKLNQSRNSSFCHISYFQYVQRLTCSRSGPDIVAQEVMRQLKVYLNAKYRCVELSSWVSKSQKLHQMTLIIFIPRTGCCSVGMICNHVTLCQWINRMYILLKEYQTKLKTNIVNRNFCWKFYPIHDLTLLYMCQVFGSSAQVIKPKLADVQKIIKMQPGTSDQHS